MQKHNIKQFPHQKFSNIGIGTAELLTSLIRSYFSHFERVLHLAELRRRVMEGHTFSFFTEFNLPSSSVISLGGSMLSIVNADLEQKSAKFSFGDHAFVMKEGTAHKVPVQGGEYRFFLRSISFQKDIELGVMFVKKKDNSIGDFFPDVQHISADITAFSLKYQSGSTVTLPIIDPKPVIIRPNRLEIAWHMKNHPNVVTFTYIGELQQNVPLIVFSVGSQ